MPVVIAMPWCCASIGENPGALEEQSVVSVRQSRAIRLRRHECHACRPRPSLLAR